jgi:hypothetical protein
MSRAGADSPYWPGAAVLVEDDGAPQLLRLLADRTQDQIRPAPTRAGVEPAGQAPTL